MVPKKAKYKIKSKNGYEQVYLETVSSQVTSMSGYVKPSDTSEIISSDSLNTAIGKLEKAIDGKQDLGNYEPSFAKKTAFNKDFGTSEGTVAKGNHTHSTYSPTTHTHDGVYAKVFKTDIGDGKSTVITVTHGLNTEDITLSVIEKASKQMVFVSCTIVDNKNIKLNFANAPQVSEFRVVITG